LCSPSDESEEHDVASNITPKEFAQKWSNIQLSESAAAQRQFIDLCRLVDHQTPPEMDRKGEFFTFEAGASKQTGGQGRAR
jgi:hypothetical protein